MKAIWFFIRLWLYAGQIIVTIGFIYLLLINLWNNNSEATLAAKVLLQTCPTCNFTGDVLLTAQQLGRLDIISLGLTILGVVLAVFGFAGFWMIRIESINICKKEASVYFRSLQAEQVIDKYVRQYMKELQERYNTKTSKQEDIRYNDIARDIWDNNG